MRISVGVPCCGDNIPDFRAVSLALILATIVVLTGCATGKENCALIPFLSLDDRTSLLKIDYDPNRIVDRPGTVYYSQKDVTPVNSMSTWTRLPTTQEAFWLSQAEIKTLKKKAVIKKDGAAAYQLANYYGFCATNWPLYLRWCAETVQLDGPREAAISLEAFRENDNHNDALTNAFVLSNNEIAILKDESEQRNNSRAALRLALYYRYAIGNSVLENMWFARAAELGSDAAKVLINVRKEKSGQDLK